MGTWNILALLICSLSVSGASNVPLVSTLALLNGISDTPYFVLLYDSASKEVYGIAR